MVVVVVGVVVFSVNVKKWVKSGSFLCLRACFRDFFLVFWTEIME